MYVFEKIFDERMEGFLKLLEIFCSKQFFLFKKNKSTIDAINDLIVDVVGGLERREYMLSILLYLPKAFDCVHHETLL